MGRVSPELPYQALTTYLLMVDAPPPWAPRTDASNEMAVDCEARERGKSIAKMWVPLLPRHTNDPGCCVAVLYEVFPAKLAHP